MMWACREGKMLAKNRGPEAREPGDAERRAEPAVAPDAQRAPDVDHVDSAQRRPVH